MQLVSFNLFRTLDIRDAVYIKPEHMPARMEEIRSADWLLFPEFWQVNALHYGLGKAVFPSVASYHLGHDKVEMTRALQAVRPEVVPWTEITAATEAGIRQVLDTFDFPFVAKEVRSSMGEGVHLIHSRSDFLRYAAANPVLYVQEYLPIHRDLRIIHVGDRVVTAYWRTGHGFHNNVARGGTVSFEDIPTAALDLVAELAGRLGIDHAGFDLAEVDGRYYVLEFNVLFGNTGLTERGIRLGDVIIDYLLRRSGAPEGPQSSPTLAA